MRGSKSKQELKGDSRDLEAMGVFEKIQFDSYSFEKF
jgi:hypothetical protein